MSFSAYDISHTIAAQFGGCQDFSGSDDTPLHTAAYEGNAEVLADILNKKWSRDAIDQRNHLGCTPLRLAATGGHTDCVVLLLDQGASVDIPDVKGQTPLHVAIKNMHYSCSEALLQRGANPNGHPNNRSTPLALAAMHGNCRLVQLLVDYEAEITLQRQGATGQCFTVDPLQLAIAYQHFNCLKLLLAAGGQPVYSSFYTGTSSPYHTLVIQKCSWRFAELLYAFGLALWVKDARGRYPWEAEPRRVGWVDDGNQALMDLLEKLKAEPRPLKSCCRLTVWRQIHSLKKKASILKSLHGVPKSLIQYLTFEQL